MRNARRGILGTALAAAVVLVAGLPAAHGASHRCFNSGDWRTCFTLNRYQDQICVIYVRSGQRGCYLIPHERRGYLNIARLQLGIQRGILAQSHVRAKVVCPERVARKGDVFYCTAYAEGRALRVRVVQRDSRGTVFYKVRS